MLTTLYFAVWNFLAHYGFTIALLLGFFGSIAGHFAWKHQMEEQARRARDFGLEVRHSERRTRDQKVWKQLKKMGL